MRDLLKDKAICESATSGPWQVVVSEVGRHTERRIFTTYEHPQLERPDDIVNVGYGVDGVFCYIKEEDAQFIAGAREGWPLALKENAELRQRIAEQQEYIATIINRYHHVLTYDLVQAGVHLVQGEETKGKRQLSLNDLHAMAEGMNPFEDEAPMLERCDKCDKKIDPEVPIQIGDSLICDICTDQGEETKG